MTTDVTVSPDSMIRPTTAAVSFADRWDHFRARLGFRRMDHRVEPGLHSIGQPGAEAPVLVTANYRLSFDAVRQALAGRSAYLLVLDPQAINVWCAAGKGTFGTDELVRRIEATGLRQIVTARKLILPQLGALAVESGVACAGAMIQAALRGEKEVACGCGG